MTIIPYSTITIYKDFFCILFVLTVVIVIGLLPIPMVWTTIGRATCSIITSLFVIMIKVLGKKGSKCFTNPMQFLLCFFKKPLTIITKFFSLITKLVELSPSEDWVVNFIVVVVVVVTVLSVSHQTRVSQGSDTN